MGFDQKKPTFLSDKLLRSWIRCKRKAWLDSYGELNQRIWTAHHSLHLDHQKKSFYALSFGKLSQGIEGCKAGEDFIVGMSLGMRLKEGQLIKVRPALLQKVAGQSIWGKYAYRPVLVRNGKRTTREIRQALALSSILLENLQKNPVPLGLSISQNNNYLDRENIFISKEIKKQLMISLNRLNEDLSKKEPPPIASDRKKCVLCCWQRFCDSEAKHKGHLSEVSGIGKKRRELLITLGINKIKDLAKRDINELTKKLNSLGEKDENLAYKLVSQARVQISNIPKRLGNQISLPEVLSSEGILIYDIESDPDEKKDFLHGFLIIKRKQNGDWDTENAKYDPLLMIYDDNEEHRWERIKRKINHYSNWPILHYGETELITIMKIAKRQNMDPIQLSSLQSRFIDIHSRVKRNWLLPLNSYGLKSIANWTGFHWRQENADGARALLWWRQWGKNSENRKRNYNLIKKIFDYNHDDCMATFAVAEWLIKQDRYNVRA